MKLPIPLVAGLAFIAGLSLVSGCRSSRSDRSSDGNTALWQQQPLTIDGSDDDWIKPLPYQNKKEQLSYAISNDRDNIYIMLTTGSRQVQQKIIQGGLTVWFNTQAEKDEAPAMGIGFPTDSRNNRDKNILAAARPDLYKDKIESLTDLKDYSLFGFNKDEPVQNFEYGSRNDKGIEMTVGFNKDGLLIYEALVPLKSLFPGGGSAATGRRGIAVGFFMDGILPPPGQEGGGGGVSVGGGLGFGSYGGSGVGISIGTGLGSIGGRRQGQLYKQSKIWQVLNLTNHP